MYIISVARETREERTKGGRCYLKPVSERASELKDGRMTYTLIEKNYDFRFENANADCGFLEHF